MVAYDFGFIFANYILKQKRHFRLSFNQENLKRIVHNFFFLCTLETLHEMSAHFSNPSVSTHPSIR